MRTSSERTDAPRRGSFCGLSLRRLDEYVDTHDAAVTIEGEDQNLRVRMGLPSRTTVSVSSANANTSLAEVTR
jgi:hypothetical protein